MQHPNRYVSLFIVLLTCVISSTTLADEWIELYGAGTVNKPKEDAFDRFHHHLGFRINHATDNGKLYSIHYASGDKILAGELGEDKLKELSFHIGRHHAYKYVATTLQIGLGVGQYTQRDNKETDFFIPVRASLLMGKKLGAGVGLFIHINEDNPVFGLDFNYALGNFN